MNEFYVYQLRVFDEALPFYVGKGKERRAWDHFKDRRKSFKRNKMIQAERAGKEILVEFVETGLSEDDSLTLEKFYIALYGRRDLGLGCLTNQTDGGDGVVNPSQACRDKVSQAMLKRLDGKKENHPMFGRKRTATFTGKTHTDEAKAKISASRVGKPIADDVKKKISEKLTGENNPQFGMPGPHAGTSWYYDPDTLVSDRFYPDQIPEGWVKGRKMKKRETV